MTANPVESLVLLGFPYAAIILFIAGVRWRVRYSPFSISSLSSQILESRFAPWGSVPFHLGIIVLFFAHLIPVLIPGIWESFVSQRGALLTVEAIGLACAVLCIAGLIIWFIRRVTSPNVQAVTTTMDLIVLGVLLAQISVGLGVATLHRWGAAWSIATTTPYLWSLVTLRPDAALVAGMPALVKFHLAGAWILLALVPFTRLFHMFTLPLQYLPRPPQKVVWANARRVESMQEEEHHEVAGRRLLLQGGLGLLGAGVLLGLGVFGKLFSYFRSPKTTDVEQAELLQTRLRRLQETAEQRELELERIQNAFIRVAPLAGLQPNAGTYFTDYHMRPAMAFKGPDGMPHLISAKCTHLGCTVGKDVNAEGRIVCPCHISWFDLKSGKPLPGSPAKLPLPILGWVLRDATGQIVVSRAPDGTMEGEAVPEEMNKYDVWISRAFATREA